MYLRLQCATIHHLTQKEGRAPYPTRLIRTIAAEVITKNTVPIEIEEDPQSREKLAEYADRPKLQLFHHWGLMEVISIIKRDAKHPTLHDSRLISPWAAHQYKPLWGTLGRNFVAIKLDKIMTPDAKVYYEQRPDKAPRPEVESELNVNYIADVANELKRGSTALVAPEGKRSTKLSLTPEQPILRGFFAGVQRQGFDPENLVIEFVGTRLAGVTDYGPWKDVKWSKPHPRVIVSDGPVYTYGEALKEAGRPKNFDAWARSVLAQVTPPEMLETPPSM